MPDKFTYEYAVIRWVPKVEREEFMNIGVILFSKHKKLLALQYHIDDKRLENFDADVDTKEILEYLKAWDLIAQGVKEGGEIACLDQASRFRWLTASKSTIIQCSKVHPGLHPNPEDVLKKLFERYVI